MLTWILFDLDNTLTDRSASIDRFAQAFFADFHSALHATVTLDAVQRVMVAGDGGGYRPKTTMFAEIQTALAWITPPSLTTIADYWYRESARQMQLRPGVEATLTELQRRGYRLGIVTNGQTTMQNATLDAIGIRPYFDTVIVSEAAGVRKPDPRIFQMACGGETSATLFVGDHPQADIEGARAAGLRAIWLAGCHDWPLELPPPAERITEIPQLLTLI